MAQTVIQTAFAGTSRDQLRSYVDFLAGDIEYLASRHGDRWGISLFDWGVRVNVGWVECLVLHSGGLRVLLEADSSPANTRFDDGAYARAPGCCMARLPLGEASRSLQPSAESHRAAISIAARWRCPPNIQRAHSTGVIEFVAGFVGRRLSNPSYIDTGRGAVVEAHDEEAGVAVYPEGSQTAVLVNRFERDTAARDACISHHGLRCSVCDMAFGERYGEVMKDFIHVHHLVPLSIIGAEYRVDPIKDLRPVCPNCHAVIHHAEPTLSIEEARALLRR